MVRAFVLTAALSVLCVTGCDDDAPPTPPPDPPAGESVQDLDPDPEPDAAEAASVLAQRDAGSRNATVVEPTHPIDGGEELPPPAPGSLEAFVEAEYGSSNAYTEPYFDEDGFIGPRGPFAKVGHVMSGTAGSYACNGLYVVAKVAGTWREVVDMGGACERDMVGRQSEFRDMGFVETGGETFLWVHWSRGGGTGEQTHDDTATRIYEVEDAAVSQLAHLLLSRTTRSMVIDEECYEATLDRGEGEYNAYNFCDFDEETISEWATSIRWRGERLQIRRTRGTPPAFLLGEHTMEELRLLSTAHAGELESPTYQ